MRRPAVIRALSFAFIVGFTFSRAAEDGDFEGRITTTLTRGDETQTFLYTIGRGALCIERGETDKPHAKNIVNRNTGAMTLVFPHNRSFVRLKSGAPETAPSSPGITTMPMMPAMPAEPLELKATGEKKDILGFPCVLYELTQRGERMAIWATDKLLPFQPWLPNQPASFGPRMMEERWGELLKEKKLFPLSATLKFESGPERLRFEVKSIKPEKITEVDTAVFQPPPDYHEMRPLPF